MNLRKIQKNRKLGAVIAFGVTFFLAMLVCSFFNMNQEKEEKLKARYTAESTISRVESQLNKYLAESNLIKHVYESGNEIDDEQFAALSSYMQEPGGVLEVHEIAKDGIVSQIYPMENNEEAMGLDMLTNPYRKKEANLAKESGEYTIAGPYELVQGGTGALLLDPIYRTNTAGDKEFWGFSILVMNWEKFINEVELDKLEDAGYHYKIWKKNNYNDEKIIIAQSKKQGKSDILEVSCEVPNDTWYFDIVPENGWVSKEQSAFCVMISFVIALLAMIGYWQIEMQRYREEVHAKEMERAAKEARSANEAKTRFLFNMSHDIRTPMNAIIGFADLLEEHIDDEEKVLNYIEKIKSSSSLLLSIINYILEMAQIESGKARLKIEVGCINDMINSLNAVFEPSMQQKNLHYCCTLNVEHEYILCDKTKIREIVLNILSNSVKYTPEGGNIALDVTEVPAKGAGGTKYQFIIEDTGIGMSKEYLPHIFEEFTRERTSTESRVAGTGLGLPIVKSLVELMKGTIKVESKLGVGTKTTITLPIEIADDEQIAEKKGHLPEAKAQMFRGKRILLAEDNDLNAEIAITILEEYGFEIDRAEDGEICVHMLQKKPERYYDLILMDIQMPNMNGYQATKCIRGMRGQNAAIPIVAMTANAFEEDREKALNAGMNAHIAKPIDVEKLIRVLGAILAD